MNESRSTESNQQEDERYHTQNQLLKEILKEMHQMSNKIDELKKNVTEKLIQNYEHQ